MSSVDVNAHVRAESPFIDDLPEPPGTLHAAVYGSPVARGRLLSVGVDAARSAVGVAGVFTAGDIPGENQVGTIIQDEPLLADDAVDYIGQPIAVVVADTAAHARAAVGLIEAGIEVEKPEFDPRRASARGELIAPARTLSLGDIDAVWQNCDFVVEGRADSGGQEHVYMETQASFVVPEDRGRLRIYAGTQSPSAVQAVTARVLGMPMHNIEVEVRRLGGAFGGKEDQATPWAAMAALAATRLNRPVKLVLRRHEDMRVTGKRHPYTSDYRLGLDRAGRILGYEVTFYQNSGAASDLSPAILERTLFHATNSYYIPNVRATGLCCRTNLPPFTAFRGFGGPQAMFVMEAAIFAASRVSGIPVAHIQEKNLLQKGDMFPYGMRYEGEECRRAYREAQQRFGVADIRKKLAKENAASPYIKRGLALMPVCFGISFTNTMLNQAGSLVHVYVDGSVSVSTAAVEMGQGAMTKIRRIVARALGVSETRVRMESTSTARVANMSPTAASTATDLNGAAALQACRMIIERLKDVAGRVADVAVEKITMHDDRVWLAEAEEVMTWEELVRSAYLRRVDLSAHAYYATPNLSYDKEREKGHPFAYHVCGTAVVIARLDALRGIAAIESLQIVHDAGRSLDLLVDRGQAEGAALQGIGWMTMEELVYNSEGRLLTDSLTTYKIPDLQSTPERVDVVFPESSSDPSAVMHTKGIGEPPFMYGIGAFFAIYDALCQVRDIPTNTLVAPLTSERILNLLDGVACGSDRAGSS